MGNTGKIIKDLRNSMGLTQEELAEKLGVQKSAVSKWERGAVSNLKRDVIHDMSKLFNVRPSYLMGWDDLKPLEDQEWTTIPVFGSIACGEPIEAFNEIIDYATIPTSWTTGGREYLVLTAKGDSMAPVIEDGDLAVIRKQPDCENGQICAVFVNGYNVTLKKVYKSKEVITLQSINPDHPPHLYSKAEEDVHILGVMVELRKRFF